MSDLLSRAQLSIGKINHEIVLLAAVTAMNGSDKLGMKPQGSYHTSFFLTEVSTTQLPRSQYIGAVSPLTNEIIGLSGDRRFITALI